MIVLASDYIGYKVVEFLVRSSQPISFLVLDSNDVGGYNKKIEEVYRSSYKNQPIYNQENLKDEKFLDTMSETKSKIGILAWWHYILKGRILSIPEKGWLNFHPSYLPFNRGKHSSFWCIVDETPCGASLQMIDEGVDTGDVLARKKIELNWEDTGKTAYEKAREATFELFVANFLSIIENHIQPVKQNLNEGTYHKSTEINDASTIDLDKEYTARNLLNIIRAKMFPPYSPAVFYDNGKKYSIEIKISEVKNEEK